MRNRTFIAKDIVFTLVEHWQFALYDKNIYNVRINSGMLIIRPKGINLSPYFYIYTVKK